MISVCFWYYINVLLLLRLRIIGTRARVRLYEQEVKNKQKTTELIATILFGFLIKLCLITIPRYKMFHI